MSTDNNNNGRYKGFGKFLFVNPETGEMIRANGTYLVDLSDLTDDELTNRELVTKLARRYGRRLDMHKVEHEAANG